MSGHSKWASIKRSKGATDVKRGKLFSQLTKAITVAARIGKNLDTVVATARAANMPKENIDRAIKKGQGELGDGVQIEEVMYEGFGPGGTALLINAFTDNRNRTIGVLRAIANKHDLTLGNPGAVRHLFQERGIIEVPLGTDIDETELILIDAGVDDIEREDDRLVGYVAHERLTEVRSAVESAGLSLLATRIALVPNMLHLIDAEQQERLLKIMETIEDLEDISSIETNAQFL
jgi:YebC/PmpR family DNA-binding regulatory protein